MATSLESVPRQVDADLQMPPVMAAIEGDGRGGWSLNLHYTGLLAGFEAVWVRVGEHRHGETWLRTRDVQMAHCAEEETLAHIDFEAGEALEGAELAFFAPADPAGHAIWDNAGHELGYYEIDARSGEIEAH